MHRVLMPPRPNTRPNNEKALALLDESVISPMALLETPMLPAHDRQRSQTHTHAYPRTATISLPYRYSTQCLPEEGTSTMMTYH